MCIRDSVQAEPSPMRNVDFAVADISVGSEWLRAAASENYRYNQSMSELQAAMKDKGGMTTIGFGEGSGDGEMPKGEGDGYRWSQTDDEVEVVVDAGDAEQGPSFTARHRRGERELQPLRVGRSRDTTAQH